MHRDQTPGNILVDESDNIKITDYGISRVLRKVDKITRGIGTLLYMAPEVFNCKPSDHSCDVRILICKCMQPFQMTFFQIFETPIDMVSGSCSVANVHVSIPLGVNGE